MYMLPRAFNIKSRFNFVRAVVVQDTKIRLHDIQISSNTSPEIFFATIVPTAQAIGRTRKAVPLCTRWVGTNSLRFNRLLFICHTRLMRTGTSPVKWKTLGGLRPAAHGGPLRSGPLRIRSAIGALSPCACSRRINAHFW